MVIGNGFLCKTGEEAYERVCDMSGCAVKAAPLPTVPQMTYYVTESGDMFGVQRSTNFFLTKPLRIERRYKSGCSIRYSIPGARQACAFMQNVMWSTFVTGTWSGDMKFTFRNGNVYDYRLDNIEPKKEEVSSYLLENMERFKRMYKGHLLDVAWYVRMYFMKIPLDDCKDIASDSFFGLCAFKPYEPDELIKVWKTVARKRGIDWMKKRFRCQESLFYEDSGEERYGCPDREVEVADIWRHIRGEKRTMTMRLFAEGEPSMEIAKAVGNSYQTVTSEICRTLQHLRRIYQKDIAV